VVVTAVHVIAVPIAVLHLVPSVAPPGVPTQPNSMLVNVAVPPSSATLMPSPEVLLLAKSRITPVIFWPALTLTVRSERLERVVVVFVTSEVTRTGDVIDAVADGTGVWLLVDMRMRLHVVDVNAVHSPTMTSPPLHVYVNDAGVELLSFTVTVPEPYTVMVRAGFADVNDVVSADEPLV
jgi:hypothetical protein